MIRKHSGEIENQPMEKAGFSGMNARFALTKEDGCPRYAMRLMEFEPNGHTALHSHAEEHEFYFLEGTPIFVDETGNETSLRVGDFVYVEPYEVHQIKNGGTTMMRMICTIPILPGGNGKCTAQDCSSAASCNL